MELFLVSRRLGRRNLKTKRLQAQISRRNFAAYVTLAAFNQVSSRGVPLPTSTRFRFDAFELDPASGELRKAGRLLKLQPQPCRVLALLIEHADQLVSREEIQRCLWQDSTFVDFEHGINFSINQIRAALGDSAAKPRYVETLPRRGYRFVGKLEQEPVPKPSNPSLEQTVHLLSSHRLSPW